MPYADPANKRAHNIAYYDAHREAIRAHQEAWRRTHPFETELHNVRANAARRGNR